MIGSHDVFNDEKEGSVQHLVEPAVNDDFLPIAALDRIAWSGDAIADGEHTWRIWCEYASVFIIRLRTRQPSGTAGIAGALVLLPTNQEELFLHKMMVHPDARGQGMGTALMQAALAQARAAVLLTVDPNNQAAVTLYRKHGFVVREHVRGYYRAHEDRYLMVRPAANDAPAPSMH